MDFVNAPYEDITIMGRRTTDGSTAQVDDYKNKVDELFGKVDKLEQKVNEVEEFFLTAKLKEPSTSKSALIIKDKEKEKHIPSKKKLQQDASRREAASSKRMQELMRQFGSIFRQAGTFDIKSMAELVFYHQLEDVGMIILGHELMTQDKWAWPFMQPVDVERLKLHDYYEIIDRPMDFSTIKNQMEAKDGTGYKHIREICSDVRLVFKNAMQYNVENSDVHVMAKKLLEKFEERWQQFLPKVIEEEKIREEEEAEAQMNMQLAQEAAHAKLARDISNELYDIDLHIEELREMVVQKCRLPGALPALTLSESTYRFNFANGLRLCQSYLLYIYLIHLYLMRKKRQLGVALSKLCPEDLSKALEIVAQNNHNFQATAEEVDLDISAQSESTLWRLKFFIKDALKGQCKSSGKDDKNNVTSPDAANMHNNNIVSKRKREICDALAKTAKKRKKKPAS
ncbi:hypothetical protein DH2020_028293 [Rehmannia glutinosa]|uniref:Uncharacterized protein n=1 Tax=Rehmannia glutinosa TaxID=99300 RepID=A0ABR0VVG3_REHGL